MIFISLAMVIRTDRKKNVRIRCLSLRSAICHRQVNVFMNQSPRAVFRAERRACILKLVPLFKGNFCRVNKVIFITLHFWNIWPTEETLQIAGGTMRQPLGRLNAVWVFNASEFPPLGMLA